MARSCHTTRGHQEEEEEEEDEPLAALFAQLGRDLLAGVRQSEGNSEIRGCLTSPAICEEAKKRDRILVASIMRTRSG